VSTAQRMNQPTVTNRPIKPAIAIPTKKRSTASITIPLGIAPTDLFDRLTGPLGNPHGPLVGAAKRPRQPGGEFASAGGISRPNAALLAALYDSHVKWCLVSKRRDRSYQGDRSSIEVKVTNASIRRWIASCKRPKR
jgi:hypothetical protein